MPMLFEVQDKRGDIWMSPHLTCGGNMLPAYNINAAPRPAWWWFCQDCKRFVRPLDPQEAMVMEQAMSKQVQPEKKSKRRR